MGLKNYLIVQWGLFELQSGSRNLAEVRSYGKMMRRFTIKQILPMAKEAQAYAIAASTK